MQEYNNSNAPRWLRCLICIVGPLCILGLLLAVVLGAQPNAYTAAVIGIYALRTTNYAFSRG